jgi:hypothetical protein
MPNWVYNGLTVEGSPESVKKMMSQLNEPFTIIHDTWDVSTHTFMKKNTLYPNPVFAFWNIIKPTDLDTYHKQPEHKPEAPLDFSDNDWYNWNVRNWGTKWDVAVSSDDKSPDTYFEETANGDNQAVYYNFQTAWSSPMPALINLSEQYPDLLFTLSYQEETGWGGECELLRGNIISESMYENQCRNCDGTYEDSEIVDCDDCGDYPCPKCGWSNDMCETHQKAYEEKK